ncbi:OmpH family outer membrane protein [Limosilactobacillus reuteri]|uniref:OmpH family outer membrane protein n=1 Tax=Limosilactobacillus reuteri TaxID=1598 RepID=UPI001C5A8E38|nr:OmpH family outer membrane protein [Limosilactobacillus reuteri]MBW3351227.1 OmpH family outer membrane protein [Limosilactobacillus reuteri]UUW67877.1 OmpH family outer membrane protein [Limosilactobacillus reuteri]
MPVQQIKHNNDGKFYHIAIDIAKEGAQLFDLTPYVKGRVGDNNFGLLVDWYRQGMLMNVNGAYKPIIDGLVGNFSFDKNGNLKMDDDASPVYSVGKPEDCGPAGQVTYYFPEQMFPKEGIFKGYLGLIDDKGNRYSGVDIWFSVLAGNARMGIACDFYISELEKAIATAEDDLKTSKKSMQDVVDEFVSKMNDLTNRLETQATTDQAALDALEQKIKQDGLFTQAEADVFKQSLTDQLTNSVNQKVDAAIAEIKSYGLATTNIRKQIVYNGYWSNLDLSHSGGVYTSTLDSIKNEIDQMAPLVDGVTLIFRQYITGGKLVVLENLDTFKQAIAYAKSKGLSIAGYKFHCTTSIDDIKSYGVSEFFADYKANVDKVTSALPESGVPLVLFNERGDLYGATSPYAGNVRNVLQDLVGETFKVDISFQSLQDFVSADPHVQEIVDSILINSYARISDKNQETTLADVTSGIDANFYNTTLYVHSLYPKKPLIMSEFGIKNNWAAFDETWSWDFSSVYDDPTGKVSYLYLRGLMQSETIKLFDGVWLWFYADLLQSEAGKEYLRAYKKGVI